MKYAALFGREQRTRASPRLRLGEVRPEALKGKDFCNNSAAPTFGSGSMLQIRCAVFSFTVTP